MRSERTPNTFIENELYKLCDGEITKQFVGNYSANSTWQPADILRTIIGTCLEHTSLEDLCSAPETPSADTILRRCNELKWTDTEKLTNGWLFEIASRLQFPKKAKLTISIDIHSIPYYGNRSYFWVTGMKRKKGTNYAISFLTVTITTRKIRCPVAMRLMTKKRMRNKLAVIGDILAELRVWLPITRVLMDRGFCQKDIITLLEEIGLEWLITAKHRSEVKKVHNEILQCIE
ncbi:MAG: transposase, partial [Candidatus Hodarchaeales archaeon]